MFDDEASDDFFFAIKSDVISGQIENQTMYFELCLILETHEC